ncbi:hypothetical protein Tco_0692206 [Tanacetum coccineum]
MSNTNNNLQTQTSSVLHNDTVSSCSTSKVQEKTQLSRSRCMNRLREVKSQFKFLTETLQDFGTMPIFKRTFSQDLDLLEQHLTKDILSQTDCNTTLTKLRTNFENALNSEFKERMQKYKRFNAQSSQDAMIFVIQNTCFEKEDSNSETTFNKPIKESSLNSETKDEHAIKYKMSTKESCMVSFQRLHSHLKRLSNNDLKGSRTENGFGRAFATLFGQDFETFTGTMFLNMDQLQKQLDNNEFQEIGSMASFKVLETQFQMFIKSKIYLNDEYIVMTRNYFLEYTRLDIPEFRDTLIQNMDYVKKSIEKRALHKMEYDSRVNERLMQTTEEKVDSSKALDASLVIIESSGT